MRKIWQLQEAKAKLSAIVKHVAEEPAQYISVHGKPIAVLISVKEYENLTTKKESFVNFMRHSPLVGLDLKLERDKSQPRKIIL
jgi:prevent-host-death family protein